jgi:5-methylcytosine-specific restriction enzyme A
MNTIEEPFQQSLYFHPLPVERFVYMSELDTIASYAHSLQSNVTNASIFYDKMEQFFIKQLCKLNNETSRKKMVCECLRNKGIVPKQSKETQIKYILDIFNAEFRWHQLIESKEKQSLKYIRLNPERGKIQSKQKAPKLETSNDLKINETLQTPPIQRLCRQCNYPCPIVTRSFCSLACLHLYKIRSRSNYVRRCLYIRDKGICDLCGLDTEKIRHCIHKKLRQLSCEEIKVNKKEWLQTVQQKFPLKIHNLRITRRGTVPRGCFWHADHILAVSQGGGNALLDGYRTLCVSCHQNMTRLLRATPYLLKSNEKPLPSKNNNMIEERNLLTSMDTLCKQNETSLLERVKLQRSQRQKVSSTTTYVREMLHTLLFVNVQPLKKEEEDEEKK